MVYSHRTIVASSSAWAGLKEEALVDEVEAVRIISGEPPGYFHDPDKGVAKTSR